MSSHTIARTAPAAADLVQRTPSTRAWVGVMPPYQPPAPPEPEWGEFVDCPECERDGRFSGLFVPGRCFTCHGRGEVFAEPIDWQEEARVDSLIDAVNLVDEELAWSTAGDPEAPMPTPEAPRVEQHVTTARWATLAQLCQQDQWWEDADRTVHRVADLSIGQRFTALATLERFLGQVDVASTPLYRALQAGLVPPSGR